QARQRYTPTRLLSVYSPVNGRSVAAWRSTAYSWGESCSRHSVSDLTTLGALIPTTVRPGSEQADDAEYTEDSGEGEPEQNQPHDERGDLPPPPRQVAQAGAEGRKILQLAVDGVGIRGAPPGEVGLGASATGRLIVVPPGVGVHQTRMPDDCPG